MRRGIGVGGVVSEIGWLSRKCYGSVRTTMLVRGLRDRFDATKDEAYAAIDFAERCGAVIQDKDKVSVVRKANHL